MTDQSSKMVQTVWLEQVLKLLLSKPATGIRSLVTQNAKIKKQITKNKLFFVREIKSQAAGAVIVNGAKLQNWRD